MPVAPKTLAAGLCCCALLAALPGCYKPAETGARGDVAPTPSKTLGGSGSSAAAAGAQTSATAKTSATATASPSPSSSRGDFRPAFPRSTATATGTARTSSRSPVRKTAGGTPPPRSRVLEAPQASSGVLGITFDSLMFPMQKDDPFSPTLLTDAVRALFDKRVKIRGYIHPSCPFEDGVRNFILVRDDLGCCFGPGALLYDCVIVDMVPGKTTKYSTRPVAVEGVLTLREVIGSNGKHEAIFHLDAEAVE